MESAPEIRGDEDDFHYTQNGTNVNFLHVLFRYGGFKDESKDRDHSHINPREWEDKPPEKGRIRTICKRCGGWIGTRPVKGKS